MYNVRKGRNRMKLFVLILNHIEKLDDLMLAFAKAELCGATILDSMGMARALYASDHNEEEEITFFGSIRNYLNGGEGTNSKTVLTVIRDDQQEAIIRVTQEVVGDFSEPDIGIMFTVPLDFVLGKGLEK